MNEIEHRKIVLAATLVALVIGMSSNAAAITSDDSENGTLSVSVSSKIAVDISPADLSYSGGNAPQPGDRVFTDDNGFTAMEIENIGSENVTEIWMNATTPSSSPFGTGLQKFYDAGNWIQVNGTGEINGVSGPDTGFTYVNRKEFNESNDLSYISTPTDEDWHYGRFRAGDAEFFWAVNTTSSDTCDGSDAANDGPLRVGVDPHNKTNTGSVDFTDGGGSGARYYEFQLTGPKGGSYGFATDVNWTMPNGNVRKYDVLVECGGDATHTLRGKYNPTMGGATDLTTGGQNIAYLLDGTNDDKELQPGEHFRVDTAIEVPFGVASSGSSTTGKLRVKARSAP